MAGKIFINYRREDARADARNIRDRLANAFGASCVFMDVDNLQPGQRFDTQLAEALGQCDVFLAVIGPRWQALLEERAAQVRTRDYVREEIAAALARAIAVIPVLIERTLLPPEDRLPPDMRALVMFQKHDMVHERFGRDLEDLVAAIRSLLRARGYTDDPLPADLPISTEVVREIGTNPLFANPPPVLATAYRSTTISRSGEPHHRVKRSALLWPPALRTVSETVKFLLGRPSFLTNSEREVSVRALRPGLLRCDQEITTVDGITMRDTSLVAANGLIPISGKFSSNLSTLTSRLTWFASTEGHIFPVRIGNRFSYAATYHGRWHDTTSGHRSTEVVATRSYHVTKQYDASSFHPELAGRAYLAECDGHDESSGSGSVGPSTTIGKWPTVFFEELGLWIEADRTSPKETFARETHSSLDKKKLYASSTLRSFTLAR